MEMAKGRLPGSFKHGFKESKAKKEGKEVMTGNQAKDEHDEVFISMKPSS